MIQQRELQTCSKKPSEIRIKICGVTTLQDAETAIRAGADYIGLIFVEASPRFITLPQAASLLEKLREKQSQHACQVVGVFQNPSFSAVKEIQEAISLDVLQLHGNPLSSQDFTETPSFCQTLKEAFSKPIFKMLPMSPETSLASLAKPYLESEYGVDGFLLEPPKSEKGLNEFLTANPQQQEEMLTLLRQRPCFIAGGLHAENIESILSYYHHLGELPFAVDVAGGVESAPGKKDSEKIRQFIQAVETHSCNP